MRLENGAIRSIKWGEIEVVRMIYGAVRDANWLTLAPHIENLRQEEVPDGFQIEFDARYQREEIDFRAHYRIFGAANGRVDFEFGGVAARDFATNRIGLCVHLPLRECVGKPLQVSSGGQITETHFPREISPHQPFFAVESLCWQPSPQCRATLELAGEVFETEDQRNWTDASFKLYGRPLAWPFPFDVKIGERIEQRVSLQFDAPQTSRLVDEAPITFFLAGETKSLPRLGLGATTDWTPNLYGPTKAAALGKLPFGFLRAEVRLFESDWREQWLRAHGEATLLKRPMELVLWFGDQPANELAPLLSSLQNGDFESENVRVEAILLLQRGAKVTPDALFETVAPTLREMFPGASIGGGTDAFFAELNRDRPEAPFDFAAYSINPQVHAEDDFSLVENLAAQAETVSSARTFWRGALHVGPVTLRRRNNPDATAPMPAPRAGELPWNVDARQSTIFGALWTMGSLKYLAESGAERITFHEVAGMRGLCGAGEMAPPFPQSHSQWGEAPFPLFWVFQELEGFPKIEVAVSRAPLEIEILVLLGQHNRRKILLANFSHQSKTVFLPFQPTRFRVLTDAAGFREARLPFNRTIILAPLSLAAIE